MSRPSSEGRREALATWDWRDLGRPRGLLAALVGLVVAAPAALVASCNVHELGHVVVAVPLGWEVERIDPCLPFGGGVEYARIGTWAGNLQGYAGGFVAAAFLVLVYLLVFARARRPLDGPGWWASGLGVALWVGPQIVIGILEGVAAPGQDYRDLFGEAPALYLLVAASMVAGGAAHVWLWRAVFRSPDR